jgi:hypothetical protein
MKFTHMTETQTSRSGLGSGRRLCGNGGWRRLHRLGRAWSDTVMRDLGNKHRGNIILKHRQHACMQRCSAAWSWRQQHGSADRRPQTSPCPWILHDPCGTRLPIAALTVAGHGRPQSSPRRWTLCPWMPRDPCGRQRPIAASTAPHEQLESDKQRPAPAHEASRWSRRPGWAFQWGSGCNSQHKEE